MKMEIGRLTTSSQASTSAFQSPKPHKMPTASAGEVTPDVSQSLCIPEVNNVSTYFQIKDSFLHVCALTKTLNADIELKNICG